MTCASDSRRSKTWFRAPAVLACAAALCSAGAFAADTPLSAPPMPAQFDITGFIQEATLDSAGDICKASDPRLAGGTIKVNNIAVIVPCNTILQMPAATLTWQELFALAPRDIGLPLGSDGIPAQTGLALKDAVALPVASAYNGPLPSYEVRIQGNVVNGRYIAGLIFISQQSANLGQGTITAIDYANAELHVAAAGAPEARAVRIRVNDPSGRFGKSHGAPGSGAALDEPGYDRRFSVDAESPTIRAATGYPMCVPRSDPFNDDDDPLCPQANRPRSPNCSSLPLPFPAFVAPAAGQFCASFVMPPAPSAPCAGPGCAPDPTRQAPFEIGDFIDFQGTLKVDSKGPYISAHTIVASLGIYTAPGTMPAYVAIDTLVQGVPAQPQLNLPQEATSRILLEGFSSDPTTLVDVFAIDLDPATGASTERWLGTATPNTLAVMGRFRFFPNAGEFSPPTREIRAVARTMCGDESYWCEMPVMPRTYANGLLAGQYHAPVFEFVFPENLVLGDPVVPASFQDMAFLYCGSGPLGTPAAGANAPLVRQLDPAPWAPPMATPEFAAWLCPAEPLVGAVAAGAPQSPPVITLYPGAVVNVNSGAAVFLNASATDPTRLPIAITWTQTAGTPPPSLAIVPAGQPNAIAFTSPQGPAQMVFTVTATNPNTGLTSMATVTVNVSAVAADHVAITQAIWASATLNRGILSVVAASDVPLEANGLPPAGVQLYVQASATVGALVPDGNGGQVLKTSEVRMAATPLPMYFGASGSLAACPQGVERCWQFVIRGTLVDPNGSGLFLPPDTITVTSSRGGAATLNKNGIVLR